VSTHDVLANLRRLRERLAEAPYSIAPLGIQAFAFTLEQSSVLGSVIERQLADRPDLSLDA
jgi:hypothetical protein